jgi:hypothetical protein
MRCAKKGDNRMPTKTFPKITVTKMYRQKDLETRIQTQKGDMTIGEWLRAERARIGDAATVKTQKGLTYLEVQNVEQEV